MTVSELLIGLIGLGVGSRLTVSGLNPVGVMCASCFSSLSCISALITKEYFTNVKGRYTNLRDWINVITFLYEKTLKTSMVDRKK